MLQLIIEIFAFIAGVLSLCIDIPIASERKDKWHRFKVFAVAAALVSMLVYYKEMAKYSFVLIFIYIINSAAEKKQKNGHSTANKK